MPKWLVFCFPSLRQKLAAWHGKWTIKEDWKLDRPHVLHLIDYQGSTFGSCSATFHEQDNSVEIGMIEVMPLWRGRGIGKSLMAFVLQNCRSDKIHSVFGSIVQDARGEPAKLKNWYTSQSFDWLPPTSSDRAGAIARIQICLALDCK